ncbi:RNA polymerase sigma factor [Algoriphagus vanfongensis]|uniref:RNA polymerase sigma factor n=1 Tax=Algoriphagus vanfongensis TaxID=426371 RepID=UPI000415E1C6|nr:RNA polymerase sigma-70 factor [Algoriphagus vanfongensis]
MIQKFSDDILYLKVRGADHQSFDLLFDRYWKRLFQYAFKLLQDQEQAEDVVQDVFIQLWENAPTKEIQHISGYLFRAVKYQVARIIRNQKWKVDLEDLGIDEIPYEEEALDFSREDLLQRVEESIEKLPPRCKEVFKLHKKEGFSTKEIALSLDLSPRTVENQIQKAMRALRADLGFYFLLMLVLG